MHSFLNRTQYWQKASFEYLQMSRQNVLPKWKFFIRLWLRILSQCNTFVGRQRAGDWELLIWGTFTASEAEAGWKSLSTALHETPSYTAAKGVTSCSVGIELKLCTHGIGCFCNCNVKAGVLVNMWSWVLLTFMDIELSTWFLLSHTLSVCHNII